MVSGDARYFPELAKEMELVEWLQATGTEEAGYFEVRIRGL